MTRAFLVLLAVAIIKPAALAQQLPPPRNPAGDEAETQTQVPALVPPQNAVPLPAQNAPQQLPPGPRLDGQAAKQTPEKLRELLAARRQAEKDRKQARIDRMNQFKAARAAEQQKLYQDWHERYLADAPVRVEYYRALAAGQSQPAISYYGTPYFYSAGPSVILPPVYAPVFATPVCGTFFSWGW
jgi:hypothetical protein